MNEKGIIFTAALVIISFLAMLSMYIYISSITVSEDLGAWQSDILDTYYKSQEDTLSKEIMAKYTAIDSLYFLAENGGFYSQSPCGNYYGKNLWSCKNPENEYTHLQPNFFENFQARFEETLNLSDKQSMRFFAYNDTSLRLSGKASTPKKLQIDKSNRTYAYYPAFTTKIDYNSKDYDTIVNFTSLISNTCSKLEDDRNGDKLTNCLQEILDNDQSFSLIPSSSISTSKIIGQNFKSLEKINYQWCYIAFNPDLSNNHINISRIDTGSSIDILDTDGDSHSTLDTYLKYMLAFEGKYGVPVSEDSKLIRLILTHRLRYIQTLTSKQYNNYNIQNPSFFKFSESIMGLLPLEEKTNMKEFLELRPCEIEEREFLIKFTSDQEYYNNSKIEYEFATYIKDRAPPTFGITFVKDKNFNQDAFLLSWKNTDSRDLVNYEIYVDNNLVASVHPWKNIHIYDSIAFKDKDNYDCELFENDEGFRECRYSVKLGSSNMNIKLENKKTYYFRSTGEFIHVVDSDGIGKLKPGKYDVKIKAYDDDNNIYEQQETATIIDDLPIAPISEFTMVPLLDNPASQTYSQINFLVESPVENNMDGSPADDFSGSYLFCEDVLSDVISPKTCKSAIGSVGLNRPHHISEPARFLIIADDPSLDQLKTISMIKMGYQPRDIFKN